MKKKLILFLVLMFPLIFACDLVLDNLGVHIKMEQRKLSNGLTVILVEDHTVPIITYQTWFRVGFCGRTFWNYRYFSHL